MGEDEFLRIGMSYATDMCSNEMRHDEVSG